MLGAVLFAHQEMQTVISVIEQMADEVAQLEWQAEEEDLA